MKITMRETRLGSPDGVQVNTYRAGETYDLPHELGESFLGDKIADRAGKTEPKPKAKPKGRAPEDKDDGPADENKQE